MSHLSNTNLSIIRRFVSKDDIVIVGVLNWGLGHAARSIPLIDWLCTFCQKVIIASDGEALDLLRSQYPLLPSFILPSYGIEYKYNDIAFNVFASSFKVFQAINKEKKLAHHIAKETGATVIISDNRLGFKSQFTKNIYLTHQVNILHRNLLVSKLGTRLHGYFIDSFDHSLIPDFEGEQSLCPSLSYSSNPFYSYIGPLTRIQKLNITLEYDLLVLLSGPEPQRTIFEKLIWKQLSKLKQYKICMAGTKSLLHNPDFPHIYIKPLQNSKEVEFLLNASKLLIARSGYTTLMDIFGLDIKAIFVPTPGQSEQEYLAKFHSKNPKYIFLNQNELNKLEKTITCLI
ncbi:MAG: glycosyltransferase [Saprospiraceae bacterium]|jgi:hypothetical protein